jgi:crotonobetainyl-CoA:carnitine CoA-transferase CaiB-like acyl-CoA transferase
MPAGPLAGVRVLDVTNTFMRPYATLLLAQQGADVLKVEQPGGDLRRRINDARGTRMGPIFLNTNRGKRSIVVDLGSADGSALFARLVAEHDVLVRNVLPAPPPASASRSTRCAPTTRGSCTAPSTASGPAGRRTGSPTLRRTAPRHHDLHGRALALLLRPRREARADRQPALRDDHGRTTHIDELYAMVADVLPSRSTAEWRATPEGAPGSRSCR